MKFPFPVLNGLDDARQNFEQLEGLDILDQTAESVLQLAAPGTKRKIAFGTVTVTFSASASSNTATITHGLGTSPASVVATMRGLSAGVAVWPVTGSVGATTFQVQGEATAALSVSVTVDWLAIG